MTEAKGKKNLKGKQSKLLIYQSYPKILQEFPSIVNPFVRMYIFDGFKNHNCAKVTPKNVPPKVTIIGKKKYFLDATKNLTEKLKDTSDDDFIPVKFDNMNAVVLLPDHFNFGSLTNLKCYVINTKNNQRNGVAPKGLLNFLAFCLFWCNYSNMSYNIVTLLTSYIQYHLGPNKSEMKPATAHELNILVEGFWYYGKLEGTIDSSNFWTVVDGHFGCYLFCLSLNEKGK